MVDVQSLSHTKWEYKYDADEKTIREYIWRQEREDRRLDQLSVFEG